MAINEWDFHEANEVGSEQIVKRNQFDNQLVYLGSTLARQLHFSDTDEKLFAMAVSQIDFSGKDNSFAVEVNIQDMREKMGLAPDEAFYTNLRKQYRRLINKTGVSFDLGNDDHDWIEGNLIRFVKSNKRKGTLTIQFDEMFKPALQYCKLAYIKVPLDDIMSYNSRYATILQRYLTTLYRTTVNDPIIQTFDFTTKQLKDMFGLSELDYCYKNGKNKGKFKRTEFEKRTLQIACDEINFKSQVMQVTWTKRRVKGVMTYFISCSIKTKIKQEPKPYDMRQIDSDAVDPNQMSIYNWLEEGE